MNWLHTLWFRYCATSMKNNGASMVLGVMLLPLLKKYLKSEKIRAQGRLLAVWTWIKAQLGRVARVRVTVDVPEKPPVTTTSSDIMGSK